MTAYCATTSPSSRHVTRLYRSEHPSELVSDVLCIENKWRCTRETRLIVSLIKETACYDQSTESIWDWLSGVTADTSSYIAQTMKWSVQIPQSACRSGKLLVKRKLFIQGLQCSSLTKCIWDPIYQGNRAQACSAQRCWCFQQLHANSNVYFTIGTIQFIICCYTGITCPDN